jgi:hypothetical protein
MSDTVQQPLKKYKTHDKDMIKKLAAMMCTYNEIADLLGMSVEGIKKRYKRIIEEGRAEGKKALRRVQYEKALAGDTKMMIWLGKQYLEQRDDPNNNETSVPLPWDEEK